jgi:hypothetical protein
MTGIYTWSRLSVLWVLVLKSSSPPVNSGCTEKFRFLKVDASDIYKLSILGERDISGNLGSLDAS